MNKISIHLDESRFSPEDLKLIRRAEMMAAQAHDGQTRKSGQPYITHPVAVAQALADWHMDAETVAAGLMHDAVEDTEVTVAQVESELGPAVASLVDGVTKIGQVELSPPAGAERMDRSSENLRKLLLAMSSDLRVIIIKLADRRHNLQTLQYLAPEKQHRIAAQSLEVFAPLADRLGMGQLKCEIEDLSFRYVMPLEYDWVQRQMAGYVRRSGRYIEDMKAFVKTRLAEAGVEVSSVEGRRKHLYSVYKKLKKADGDIDKIYDLIALRVMVTEEADCYKALGILHQQFKPMIYRIKDYIAVPKPNGYRSLHTTVFGLGGRISEFQIRTSAMHDEAERGLAAHFYYDSQKDGAAYTQRKLEALPKSLSWVQQLADISQQAKSGAEFVEDLQVDLFRDRIFIFSPNGDLYDLPEGATPIDFGFAVHTDIGLKAYGAKVNGRLVPLSHKLENRDLVEIITRKTASPSRDWLGFVKTPGARQKIRTWLRTASRDQNTLAGRQALDEAVRGLGLRSVDELPKERLVVVTEAMNYKEPAALLAAIGEGSVTAAQVMRRLFPPEPKPAAAKAAQPTGRVVVAGSAGLSYRLGNCCKPAFPADIVGYITRGSGVTVHRLGCRSLPPESDRYLPCQWDTFVNKAESPS